MRHSTTILSLILTAAGGISAKERFDAGGRRLQLRTVDEALAKIVALPDAERKNAWDRFIADHVPQRIEALKHYRDTRLVELFVRLAGHKDPRVRHRALLILGRIEHEQSSAAIARALDDEDLFVRERAAISLRERVAKPTRRRQTHPSIRAILGSRGILAERQALLPVKPSEGGFMHISPPSVNLSGGGIGGGARTPPSAPQPTKGFAYPTLHEREELDAPPHGYDGVGVYAIADGVVQNRYSGSPDLGYTYSVRHQLTDNLYIIASYGGLDRRLFFTWHQTVRAGDPIAMVRPGYRAVPRLRLTLFLGPKSHGRKLDAKKTIARWMRWSRPLIRIDRSLTGKLRTIPSRVANRQYSLAYKTAVQVRNRAEPGSELHADAVYCATLLFEVPRKALARATARLEDGWPQEALDDGVAVARACGGIPSRAELVKQLDKWQNDDDFARAKILAKKLSAATKRSMRAKTAEGARAIIRELEPKLRGTLLEPRVAMLLR